MDGTIYRQQSSEKIFCAFILYFYRQYHTINIPLSPQLIYSVFFWQLKITHLATNYRWRHFGRVCCAVSTDCESIESLNRFLNSWDRAFEERSSSVGNMGEECARIIKKITWPSLLNKDAVSGRQLFAESVRISKILGVISCGCILTRKCSYAKQSHLKQKRVWSAKTLATEENQIYTRGMLTTIKYLKICFLSRTKQKIFPKSTDFRVSFIPQPIANQQRKSALIRQLELLLYLESSGL